MEWVGGIGRVHVDMVDGSGEREAIDQGREPEDG